MLRGAPGSVDLLSSFHFMSGAMDFNLEEFLEEQPEATDPRVEEEDDDDGEEEPETTQPRPRTKVEGERRKRGRPRVNPRDQSATEVGSTSKSEIKH